MNPLLLDQLIEQAGPVGSRARMEAIAAVCSGTRRGKAARVCLKRRALRRELLASGMPFEQACLLAKASIPDPLD